MTSRLSHLAFRTSSTRRPRDLRKPPRAAGRNVEVLELRTLLSTWYVDSDFGGPSEGSRSAPFAALQAAIDTAEPGDTILVETGRGYHESATIDVSRSDLTVRADEGAAPVLDGTGA